MMRRAYLLFLLASALLSCGQQGPTIDFGRAECAHCRMNVVDRQYGAALITLKGRQYVFDDISCMVHFVENGTVAADQVASWHVCDHAHPGTLIDATTASYLHGPDFRSPMRGDMAAFATDAQRTKVAADRPVDTLDWEGARRYLLQ